jgi:hypothetical protein
LFFRVSRIVRTAVVGVSAAAEAATRHAADASRNRARVGDRGEMRVIGKFSLLSE